MYKIKVVVNGVGIQATLYKKWWVFWLPDTVVQCSNGGSPDSDIRRWIRTFKIPRERFLSEYPIYLNYYDFT